MTPSQSQTPPTLPIIAITLFFGLWFSLYSYPNTFDNLFHLFRFQFIYGSGYNLIEQINNGLILFCVGLMLWPRFRSASLRWGLLVFVTALLMLTVHYDFPHVANHSMMMVCFAIGYFVIFFSHILRPSSATQFKKNLRSALSDLDYLPLLRFSLIIMYFFGTFHKINSGFLHEEGCWHSFYKNIPWMPDFLLDPQIGLYLAGYGTLVVEALALIFLLFARTKYYGMLLGMSFHFLIGINFLGTIAHFSALSFALHMTFLSQDSIEQFQRSWLWKAMNRNGHGVLVLQGILAAFFMAMIAMSYSHIQHYGNVGIYDLDGQPTTPFPWAYGMFFTHLMWWVYSVPLMAFVALYGRSVEERPKPFMVSRNLLGNIASLLLIVNAITPYIGLKSNADLAMFSNLRTEWGQSNHYVITKPWDLFPYLNEQYYVSILEASHNRFQNRIKEDNWLHIFKIQNEFYKNPTRWNGEPHYITYKTRDGELVDVTKERMPDHFFFQTPSFWTYRILKFTDFRNNRPQFCSSR